MRRPLIGPHLAGGLALACTIACPTLASGATRSGPEQVTLKMIAVALSVNGRDAGQTTIVLTDRLLVEASALERTGLGLSGAPRVEIGGRSFVDVEALAPLVTVSFDEADVALRVTAQPGAFARTSAISPLGHDGSPARLDDTSLFVNYAAHLTSARSPLFASEVGWRGKGLLVQSTFSSWSSGVRRIQSTATYDDRRRMARWEAGDTLAAPPYGGAVPMFGLTVSRQFSIDPLFHAQAPLSLSGATAVPAMAEVYVNNQLVGRSPVQPGTFELRDLAPPTGSGSVRVVLKDEFGREQQFVTNYYRSPDVLRRGLHEYRYSAGAPRSSWDGTLGAYGGFAASAEHRLGLRDWFTIAGHAARRAGALSGGLSAAFVLPFGEVEADVAGAGARDTQGISTGLAYAFRSRRVLAASSVRLTSDEFAATLFSAGTRPGRIAAMSSADATVGRGVSIGVRHVVRSIEEDAAVLHDVGVQASYSLRIGAAIAVSITRPVGHPGFTQGYVTVTVPMARRSSASVSHAVQADAGTATSVSVQRSLPLGPGWGYQLQWQDRRESIGVAAFEARTGLARLEARHDVHGRNQTGSLSIAGAVVVVGGGLHFSAPVDDAYALVRVPGVRGVRAYASHQYVGRTGRHGDLLVPSLVSYNPNRLAIEERDIPVTLDVPITEALVQPGLRGGGLVLFPVQPIDRMPPAGSGSRPEGPAAPPRRSGGGTIADVVDVRSLLAVVGAAFGWGP